MANVDRPFGFVPIQNSYNPLLCRLCYVNAASATAMFRGDLVKLYGENDATGKYIGVTPCTAAGDVPCGVVLSCGANSVGLSVNPSDLTAMYLPATTEGYALVCLDPAVLLVTQVDDDAYTLAATDFGLNADALFGAGSTTTGVSGQELDASTLATTNSLHFQLLYLHDEASDNGLGDFAKVVVRFNIHQFGRGVDQSGTEYGLLGV